MYRLSIAIFFVFSFFRAFCQVENTVERVYQIPEGLPSHIVYDLIQSRDGFLWLATEDGVCRFNGQKFETFTEEGLPSEACLNLYEDGKGNIWMFFLGKIFIWQQGQIKSPNNDTRLAKVQTSTPYLIVQECPDGMYLTTREYKLFKITQEETYLVASNAMMWEPILGHYDLSIQFQHYSHLSKSNFCPTPSFRRPPFLKLIAKSSNKVAWIQDNELSYYNEAEILEKHPLFGIENPKCLTLIEEEKALVAAENGSFLIDMQGHILKKLNTNAANSILRDNNGIVWIGTKAKGLIRVQENFLHILPYTKDKSIQKAWEEQGTLKLIYENRWEILKSENDSEAAYVSPFYAHLRNVVPYKKENIIINSGSIKIGKDSIILNSIKNISFQGDSLLWISAYKSVLKVNLKKETLDTLSAPNAFVYHFVHESQDTYLLASKSGTFRYLLSEKKFQRLDFLHPAFKEPSYFIFYDSLSASYFIGTESSGIIQYQAGKVKRVIKDKDGLYQNNAKQIIVARDGSLWILHKYGITRLTGDRREWKNISYVHFSYQNGLNAEEINAISAGKERIWLATNRGVFSIDTRIKPATPQPQTLEISIENQQIRKRATTYFSYSYNRLPTFIELAYPNLMGEHLSYFYTENGKDWIQIKNNLLTFSNLAPGEYTLSFKVKHLNGSESPVKTCKISVIPLWWQRKDVRASALLSLLLILLGIYQYVRKQKNKRLELVQHNEREIARLRSVALQNQMNPHFIFNALNTLQNQVLENNQEKAVGFIHKLAQLLRTLLHLSLKPNINLAQEVAFLELYLQVESLNETTPFSWEITVDEELYDSDLVPPLLLQPFVENAIKHGIVHAKEKPFISIHLYQHSANVIKVSISDNGLGMEESLQYKDKQSSHQSAGTMITLSRLKLYPQLPDPPFFYEENIPSGTKVTVYLPIVST